MGCISIYNSGAGRKSLKILNNYFKFRRSSSTNNLFYMEEGLYSCLAYIYCSILSELSEECCQKIIRSRGWLRDEITYNF